MDGAGGRRGADTAISTEFTQGEPPTSAVPPAGPSGGGGDAPRWWTVVVPCLLTLPVSAGVFLLASALSVMNCFDTCEPGIGRITAIAIAELVLVATTAIALVTGLAAPSGRLAMMRISCVACILAYGMLLFVFF